jgi:trehalose 6-phosphate synthase
VIVRSCFAVRPRELNDAVIVNPYAIDDSAHALAQASNMPEAGQATRMRAMRAVVAEFNASRWVGEMLMDAARARVGRKHHQHHDTQTPCRFHDDPYN